MSSAIAKMVVDMVMKELPEETRQLFSPESLQRITTGINNYISFTKESLTTLVSEQAQQGALIEEILERLKNDNGSSGGSSKRKSARKSDIGNDGGGGGSTS